LLEIRKRLGDGAAISMRDVYLHPTVESLAQHLASGPHEENVARPERKPLRIPSSLEY